MPSRTVLLACLLASLALLVQADLHIPHGSALFGDGAPVAHRPAIAAQDAKQAKPKAKSKSSKCKAKARPSKADACVRCRRQSSRTDLWSTRSSSRKTSRQRVRSRRSWSALISQPS